MLLIFSLRLCVYLWIIVNYEYPGTSKINRQDLIPMLNPGAHTAQTRMQALRLSQAHTFQTKQAIY